MKSNRLNKYDIMALAKSIVATTAIVASSLVYYSNSTNLSKINKYPSISYYNRIEQRLDSLETAVNTIRLPADIEKLNSAYVSYKSALSEREQLLKDARLSELLEKNNHQHDISMMVGISGVLSFIYLLNTIESYKKRKKT